MVLKNYNILLSGITPTETIPETEYLHTKIFFKDGKESFGIFIKDVLNLLKTDRLIYYLQGRSVFYVFNRYDWLV